MKLVKILVAAVFLSVSASASAFNIVVSHWGLGMYGVPYAVAKGKGFFKQRGIDVTGFIGGHGGGTTLRNVLASPVPFGEVAVGAAVAAIQHGVHLTIVNGGVISLADLLWITRKDEPINSIQDLKGKVLAYSNPKSVTDMVTILALKKAGLTNEVKRVAVGGLGAGLTALRENAVAATFIIQPLYAKELAKGAKYKIAFTSISMVPHMTQSVGVVRTDYLRQHPKTIKAILGARCEAVQYIERHPREAAVIMAREYKLAPKVARAAIEYVLGSKTPYWSLGGIDYPGMDTVLKAMRQVKAIPPGHFDWSKVIDTSYLPTECRKG